MCVFFFYLHPKGPCEYEVPINTGFNLLLQKAATRRQHLFMPRLVFLPFFFSFAFIFAVKLTSDAEFACSSVGQLYLVTHGVLPPLFRFFFPIEAITMCSVNLPAFSRAFLNISLIHNDVYIHVD